jgi:hypothetical protein
MKHITSYKDIPGWINDAEHIYEEIVNEAKDGDIVAEIGTLLGQSSCRMASLIKDSSKDIKFYSIDLFWMIEQTFNNISETDHPLSFLNYMNKLKELNPGISIMDIVKHGSFHLEVDDYVEYVTCDEKYAHRLFENDSVKFLWIDGDHTGDIVYNDLVNNWPKIKNNGVIAGDDYADADVEESVQRFIKERSDISEIRLHKDWHKNYFFLRKKH